MGQNLGGDEKKYFIGESRLQEAGSEGPAAFGQHVVASVGAAEDGYGRFEVEAGSHFWHPMDVAATAAQRFCPHRLGLCGRGEEDGLLGAFFH